MTLSTSTDHLVIMSISPSFLSQPMRYILCTSHTDSLATNFSFSLLHFMVRVCFCLSLRKDWRTWWKACVTPCLCQIWAWCLWEGGAAAGGWWWACRHAQTWSSPLSANLGRAELVKHTRARSPAQLPRHAHTLTRTNTTSEMLLGMTTLSK